MASPHPQPTALKKLRGNPGKRALPKDEPKPSLQLPPVPPWLKPVAVEAWNSLVPELQRLGVITAIDTNAFARYCLNLAEWKEIVDYLAANGPDLVVKDDQGVVTGIVPTPYPKRKMELEKLLLVYEREFGLTPSARTRIHANPQGEKVDDLDAMLNGEVVG